MMRSSKGGTASNFSIGKFHSITNADSKIESIAHSISQNGKKSTKRTKKPPKEISHKVILSKKAVSNGTRSHHLVFILLH